MFPAEASTSLVVSTLFAAPEFAFRDRSTELASALQSDFGEPALQSNELVVNVDSSKPAEWWLWCPLRSPQAHLAIGIRQAQITFQPAVSDGGQIADTWGRLESAVAQALSSLDGSVHEIALYGHFPVSDKRFGVKDDLRAAQHFRDIEFSGSIVHLPGPAPAQSRVLLDRSTELPRALHLWIHSRWPAETTVGRCAEDFLELVSQSMEWADLDQGR